jgi:hypothetical protein
MDDASAVAQARAGDSEAFRVLVERHSRALYRLAHRMTGNAHDAEVRKTAMFWLGQSGDPRALASFEEVLGR